MFSPFAESDEGNSTDAELAERATSGDRTALERHVLRHQAWIDNIAVRMVFQPRDAPHLTSQLSMPAVARGMIVIGTKLPTGLTSGTS